MKREKFLQSLIETSYPLYDRYFKYNKKAWKINMTELAEMEDKSLGKELFLFYKRNGIEKMDRFENHDVCHVITGYLTDCIEESCMQFFLLSTGKKSIFVYGTILLSLIVLPEHFPRFIKAYKHGFRFHYFDDTDFETILNTPLTDIRKRILKHEETRTPILNFIIDKIKFLEGFRIKLVPAK